MESIDAATPADNTSLSPRHASETSRTLASSTAPALAFTGGVRVGAATLLNDIAFTAAAGAWTAVLGRSGVGKTTLLKALGGLAPEDCISDPARASDGASISGRVAWMSQLDLLLPWASAVENAVLGARLRGEAIDLSRARETLIDLGLGDRLDATPDALSGGQRQRVALARTLLENRPIVLLDEPFSALDAATRADLQELAWNRLVGRTVVIVTHDPLEAARLAHAAWILSRDGCRLETLPGAPLRDPADPTTIAAAAALTIALRATP